MKRLDSRLSSWSVSWKRKSADFHSEKKALVYISSGVPKTGVENQSQLLSTINAAVRANVAFYPIDVGDDIG